MLYVNVKCKCNNEVVNFILAEAKWVRSGSRIRTSGPRAWAPPRLRNWWPQKYFPISHTVYVVGAIPHWLRQGLVAGCEALSFCTSRTRRQPVAFGWGLLVLRALPTLAGLGDCRSVAGEVDCISCSRRRTKAQRLINICKLFGGVGDFRGNFSSETCLADRLGILRIYDPKCVPHFDYVDVSEN